MFKNTLKALTSFTLLLGCYYAYVAAFGWVVEQFRAANADSELVFPQHASNSKKQADALALEEMGAEHWSVKNEHLFAFYNAEHGFWAYTLNAEQPEDKNGVKYERKRMVMTPFLMIWKSSNGKSNHVLECEEATLDMSQPLGLSSKSNSEPTKLKHALFERDVRIRDDRGTPKDRRDDMNIGPMRRVEFDDNSQQITTDDHVVIKDPDTLVTADGMLIQLRTVPEEERALTPNAASGFAGADYIIFRKTVHVNMRNVGNSGMLPGSSGGKKTAAVSSDVRAGAGGAPDAVPMDITCDGPMRIDMAEKPDDVLVGPPTPPDPTRVQFDRNVVACRGVLNVKPGPEQLLCDTLRLTLLPGSGTPSPSDNGNAASRPRPKAPNPTPVADAGKPAAKGSATPEAEANSAPAPGNGGSVFGNLTLKRAHATGHAVWLYLPASGVKLLCNELIHERLLPYKPDLTYFRGDRTRRLEIEKVDTIKEGPDAGKVATVTRIWTDDATMFDDGGGIDKANIRARGQGRLEIHSERGPAVDRIAIWQKELNVYNVLSPDGEIQTKLVWLEGTRPRFIDRLQNVSIDSAELIKIWLKPKPTGTTADSGAPNVPASTMPRAEVASNPAAGGTTSSSGGMDGGDLQIEKLVAIRDVHLNAPNRKMTARDRLDADFVNAEPVVADQKKPVAAAVNEDLAPAQPATATATAASGGGAVVARTTDQPAGGPITPEPAKTAAAAPQPTVLPMTAIGNKVWAKVALAADSGNKKPSEAEATGPAAKPAAATGAGSDVRELWMWGAVAIHQDPAPGKQKGESASGEAVYLLNRGENRALTKVFQRDPNEVTKPTTRLPLARVTTDDMDITGRIIQMDQEVDKIWVDGEGTLTQMTDRGMFSDKSAKPADAGELEVKPTTAVMAREDSGENARTSVAKTTTRITAQPRGAEPEAAHVVVASKPKPKPKRRAGVTVSDKEEMKITWTDRMEFDGRTNDPEGRPSARADFYGIVDLRMTDSALHCTKKMIAFTDKEVPLTQLGKMSQPNGEAADGQEPPQNEDAAEAKEPQAQLALLYCYGEPWMATRKMDEETPVTLQKQWIEAKERIDYDRRTGNFFVPGQGIVYLYDRTKNSDSPPGDTPATGNSDEAKPPNAKPAEAAGRTAQRRVVTPTSGRTETRAGSTAATTKGTRSANSEGKTTERNGPPPLILTEIHFFKEMRGRFGTGQNGDSTENRWSEFFGDVQVRREEVPNEVTKFKMDSFLRKDGFYLTSQVLRVITEPAPIGSPPKTPARNFMKAWDRAMANTIDKTIKSDIITYDSSNDQIHAYCEEGGTVLMIRQLGNDQPSTSEHGTSVVMNPKTGACQMYNLSTIRFVEESGSRPTLVPPPDPNAKPPKKNKQQFRIPNGSLERRGFTGS